MIILIVLYFEDKLSYLRELFILPNFKQSVILISFISILDLILVIIYVFLYDSIAGSPASDSLSEMPLFLLFIALVIAAPLLEEILFRGYLLDKIRNSYSDNFAIMVTGILFGIMHYDILAPLDFAQTGSATIGGFLYAWLRIKTGSLWPSIICHSLWNGTIFFLFFVTYI
jgi:membrane protease YdiL (CAAX protease family)